MQIATFLYFGTFRHPQYVALNSVSFHYNYVVIILYYYITITTILQLRINSPMFLLSDITLSQTYSSENSLCRSGIFLR